MLKIWRLFQKQNSMERLPIIIPLVLYHGRSGSGQTSTRFSSLLNGPTDALAAYIPDFNYVLYDLTKFTDEQIKGTVMARAAMLLFKHIFDPQVRDKLPAVLSLLVDLSETQTVPQYLETVFRYIICNVVISSTYTPTKRSDNAITHLFYCESLHNDYYRALLNQDQLGEFMIYNA